MNDSTLPQESLEVANQDPNHDIKSFKFGFRTLEDNETGVKTKRPTIEVKLPVLSFEGIVSTMRGGGKGLELLQQAVETVYTDYIKDLLGEDQSITPREFPLR